MYCAKGIVLTFFLILFKVSNDDLIDARIVSGFGVNNMRFPYIFQLRKPQNRHIIRRPLRYMPVYRAIKLRNPQPATLKIPLQKSEPSLDEMISQLDNIEKQLNSSRYKTAGQSRAAQKAIQHLNQRKTNNMFTRNVQFTPTKSQKTSTTVIPTLSDSFDTTSQKYTTIPSIKNKTSVIDNKLLLLLAMSLATDSRSSSSKVNNKSDNPGYEIPSSERKVFPFNNAESTIDSIAVPFKRQLRINDGRPDSRSTKRYVDANEKNYRKPNSIAIPPGRFTDSVPTSTQIPGKHINTRIRQSLKVVGTDMPPFPISSTQHSPIVQENTKAYSQKNKETNNIGSLANDNIEQHPQHVSYHKQSKEIYTVLRPTSVNEFHSKSQRKYQQSDVIQPQRQNFLTFGNNDQSSQPHYNTEVSQLNIDAPLQHRRINNRKFQQTDRPVLLDSPTHTQTGSVVLNTDTVRSTGHRHTDIVPSYGQSSHQYASVIPSNAKSSRQSSDVVDQMKYGGRSIKPQLFEAIPTSVQALDTSNNRRKHQNPSQRERSQKTQPDLSGPLYQPFLQQGRANLYDVNNNGVTSQHSNGITKEISKRGETSLYHQQSPQDQGVSSYVTNKAVTLEHYREYKPKEQFGPTDVTNKASSNSAVTSKQFQQYTPQEQISPVYVENNEPSKSAGTQQQYQQYKPQEQFGPSDVTNKASPNSAVTSKQFQQYTPQEQNSPVYVINNEPYKSAGTQQQYQQYKHQEQLGPSDVTNIVPTQSAGTSEQYTQYTPREQLGPIDVTSKASSNSAVTSGQYQQYLPKEHLRSSDITNNEVLNTHVTSVKYKQYIPQGQIGPSNVPHQVSSDTGVASVTGQFQQYIPRKPPGPRDVTDNMKSNTVVTSGQFKQYIPREQNGVTNNLVQNTGVTSGQYHRYIPTDQLRPSDVSSTSQRYIPERQLGPREVTHNVASNTAMTSGGEFKHYTPKNFIDQKRVTNTVTRQTGIVRGLYQADTTGGQRDLIDVTNKAINNGASMSNTETGVIKGMFKLNNQVLSCVCQHPANDPSSMYKQEPNHG